MVAQQRVQRVQSSFLHPLLLSSSRCCATCGPLLRNLTFEEARHHFLHRCAPALFHNVAKQRLEEKKAAQQYSSEPLRSKNGRRRAAAN
jgi:hypothetical protein